MTEVNHSGNICSGLCPTPCRHPDCWQCQEYKDNHPEVRVKNEDNWGIPNRSPRGQFGKQPKPSPSLAKTLTQIAQEINMNKEVAGLVAGLKAEVIEAQNRALKAEVARLSAIRANPPGTTTITRQLLDELAKKAGLKMDWNGGNPTFTPDDAQMTAQEIKAMLKKMAPPDIIAQVANGVAKSAVQTMDKMAGDVLKADGYEKMVRRDIEANEQHIIEKMKKDGASDADIETYRQLVGGEEPGAVPEGVELNMQTYVDSLNANLISVSSLYDLIAATRNIGFNPSGIIIHPSVIRDL